MEKTIESTGVHARMNDGHMPVLISIREYTFSNSILVAQGKP